MASLARSRRSFVRRISVLLTVVVAGGGLVALEHTATGASTGTPSGYGRHVTTTTKHKTKPEHSHSKHHHPTTSTSSTTTTSTTTTTTMPKDPGKHCRVEHGKHHHKKFKCRVPSGGTGGTGPMHPHNPKHPHKKQHDNNKNSRR